MSQIPELRDTLFGRNRTGTFLGLGFAMMLFIGIFILRGWAEMAEGETFGTLPISDVVFVVVVGGGFAAVTAFWNDGLLLSWLLVFCPVIAWVWPNFVQGPVFFKAVVHPFALAAVAAILAGTAGYVIGRRIHMKTSLFTEEDPFAWDVRLILGHDPSQLFQWAERACVLLFVSAGFMYSTRPYIALPIEGLTLIEVFLPIGALNTAPMIGTIVIFGWMGLASWPAYRDNGLLSSWGILFGPIFGATLIDFTIDSMSGSSPIMDFSLAFLAALIIALVLGTGGYILGRGLRGAVEYGQPSDKNRIGS